MESTGRATKVEGLTRRGLDSRPRRRILDEYEEEPPPTYYRVPRSLFNVLHSLLSERLDLIQKTPDSTRRSIAIDRWSPLLQEMEGLRPEQPIPTLDRRRGDRLAEDG